MQQGRSLAVLVTCGAALAAAGCRDAVPIPEPAAGPPPGDKPRYASAIEHPGAWSAVFNWPMVAAHLTLTPDGKVLTWTSDDHAAYSTEDAYVWDPATGAFRQIKNTNTDLFCSAHTFLPNGDLLVSGGHIHDGHGSKDTNIFNYRSGTWGRAASMRVGRWYPSSITLASGEVVTLGGTDEHNAQATVPEIWTGNGWSELPDASRAVPYYPWIFQAPDGRVVMAGPDNGTFTLNTAGRGRWDFLSDRIEGGRPDGTAVMYEPGKVLALGGGYPAKNSAEVLNLNAGTGWQRTSPMKHARRHVNATVLANGQVLVTGGHTGSDLNDAAAVLPAEIWDPATEAWTTVASMKVPRLYHSAALLLPDGRVLSAGGGRCGAPASSCTNYLNAEIYTPPYLFNADGSMAYRPTITGAPESVGYGQSFAVQTPDAADIGKVTLVRLSAVTHSFNMNQRFNDVGFTRGSGQVNVTAPSGPALAPPGHYMLFILNSRGVPSVSRVIQLLGGSAPPRAVTKPVVSRHSGKCMDVDGGQYFVQIWGCHGGGNQSWTVPGTGVTGEVRGWGDRCLDAAAGNDGDAIVASICTGAAGQQWTHNSTGELRGINGRCVNVTGAGTADGTRLILKNCGGGDHQKWGATTGPVISRYSGKCVDVDGGQLFVQIWECLGGVNQSWSVPATGVAGEVRGWAGLCLSASGGTDGDPIVSASCSGNANQQWTYTAAGEIRGLNGKCVHAANSSTANGTRLLLWTCNGGGNQQWGFAGPTTGPAVAQQSGKCMDVDGGQYYVQIWGCHGGGNQQWTVPAAGVTGEVRDGGGRCLDAPPGNDGDPVITSPCGGAASQRWTYTSAGELRGINGKCVDVNGGGTADGTRLLLWTCQGGSSQKWTLPNR